MRIGVLLAVAAIVSISTPLAAQIAPPTLSEEVRELVPTEMNAARPRFSPTGDRIVFESGDEGERELWLVDIESGALTQLTTDPADDAEPAFSQDGERIYFSSDRGTTGYDIHVLELASGAIVQLTAVEGDAREPDPSPLQFSFSVVYNHGCSGIGHSALETYDKILFSWIEGEDGTSEIGFVSSDGEHVGRLTSGSDGDQTGARWSGDGRSITWSDAGDERVVDAELIWDQDFMNAWQAISSDPTTCFAEDGVDPEAWRTDECLLGLTRSYADTSARTPLDGAMYSPAFSANQTTILASSDDGGLYSATREVGQWTELEGAPDDAVDAVWSPDGSTLAYALEGAIVVTPVEQYLSDVINLYDYPELWLESDSELLAENGFVARPGTQREFWTAYDELAYAERGVFVTVDALLQTFHDEFADLLESAEGLAEGMVRVMAQGLYEHYLERSLTAPDDETLAYTTAYFGTAWTLLEAGRAFGVAQQVYEDVLVRDCWGDPACAEADGFAPPDPDGDLIAESANAHLETLDESVRDTIREWVERAIEHEELETEWGLPGTDTRYGVDFTQFRVRGHYVSEGLHGYFMAMMWLGLVPLPAGPSAFELVDALENGIGELTQDERTYQRDREAAISLIDAWQHVDALVSGFMGRPVDTSVAHLLTVRDELPEALAPYDAERIEPRLDELLGELPFRGLEGVIDGDPRARRFSFFPRRAGQDTAFFTHLTHPDVEGRGFPSATDVFAGSGVQRARGASARSRSS